jgi:hypothetical protein
MVSPLVSKDIINIFEDRFENYKYDILSKVQEKYLSNITTKEELFKEYTIDPPQKKPKLIIMAKNPKDMCMAKVYKYDGPHRCKRKKYNDNEYCKHHILLRNYGRFDE